MRPNSLAFQSPELNSPAFQLLGLKLSNPSAFQSLGLVSPILLHFYHLDSTLRHPNQWVSIICQSNDRDSRLNLTAFQSTHSAASRPRSGAFGPLSNFLRQRYSLGRFAASFVLTRPLRGLVRGPSVPSVTFCAKGTHSAASRPRSGAFGPLNNFLRQKYSLGRFAASFVLTRPLRGLVRGPSVPSVTFCAKGTHSAASRPRSWAFGPLSNFLRKRYSLGRFAASFVGLRPPQLLSAPKVLTRPLRGLVRGPSAPSVTFCAKGTHSAASRPRSWAFGPLSSFLRQRYSLGRFAASFVLTRPLRGLVRGPSAPSVTFCAKGTHSAASRPRSWAFGPLSYFLRQRYTHSAASRPRSGAFGPLNNFLRQRYSLGRFAA
ncbi:hypothetical protein niasHT_004086 [Heterodera trifolii]|uniref:Uncharacterized protein n=1 Tax=Heterodera trifolii TaxID=157864 RepID=A0ABD2LST3_9BILA